MKPPKWLFLCLVGAIVLALIASLWLWIDLPVRAARRFLALVADGKFDEANEFMVDARWERDEMYVFLEASGRKVVLPMKEWKKSFSDIEVRVFSRSFVDVARGTCSFQGRETPFGTYRFTAQRGAIYSDTDFERLTTKTGWGVNAGRSQVEPFDIQGTYNWPDQKGGTIVLEVGGTKYGTLPACFGSGRFRFDCKDVDWSKLWWTVEFTDSSGKSKKLRG